MWECVSVYVNACCKCESVWVCERVQVYICESVSVWGMCPTWAVGGGEGEASSSGGLERGRTVPEITGNRGIAAIERESSLSVSADKPHTARVHIHWPRLPSCRSGCPVLKPMPFCCSGTPLHPCSTSAWATRLPPRAPSPRMQSL